MPLRDICSKWPLFVWIAVLSLGSCSKKDQASPSHAADFQQFSLFPGQDKTVIDAVNNQINVRVPDTIVSGNQLAANFSASPQASVSVQGVAQQTGITRNNFEEDLSYIVTAGDQQSKKTWTVRATNNDNSISWGLGHFLNHGLSEDRVYNWYIDQSTSGPYALVNCGPSSVTMAIKWSDSGFSKTALNARETYETGGGWWFTSDIDAYLGDNNIPHAIISLSPGPDSTGIILMNQLDHQQIIILCLDMNYVRPASQATMRVDKFYPTSPGWGHFIVLKGYKKVDEELFFEAYDPYSFGQVNTDQTLKGLNRFYRYEDLAAACLPWWNFAFVVAKKGQPLDLDAIHRALDPAHVPVAHNF